MSDVGLSANSKNIKKFQLEQKGRNLLLVIVFVLPFVVGGIIYVIFQQYVNDTTNSQLSNGSQTSTTQTSNTSAGTPSYIPDPTTSTTTASGGTTSTQPSTSGAGASTSSTIPNGVDVAINSIETNGIKRSSYISDTLDTSNIPDGSTVSFDRNSWVQYGPESGSINASVSAYGNSYSGNVTFQSYSGVWKVSGYSLN